MELKELTDMLQSAVEEMHKGVERMDAEIKRSGEASAETKASVEKVQADITTLMAAKEEMEVKFQRATVPSAVAVASPEDETKAARKAAFLEFARTGDDGELRKLIAASPENRKALVEDATGQYLVTEELDAEIVRTLPKITIIRGLATVRTIGKDRIKMRSLGKVSVGWGKLETDTEITESSPLPGTPTHQYVEDLYGLAKIGEDELMDSDFNLEPILADSFSRAIGEAEDLAFILGAGHDPAGEPEGITVNTVLVTAKILGGDGVVTVEKFMELLYKVPSQYRRNGVFVVNSNTELLLRQLRSDTSATTKGDFLWQPSVQADKPNTFLGKAIYTQDDMKMVTDADQVIAIFGDFKAGYRIIDRAGMTIQRLTELYAEAGLVGFKIHKRVGGSVMRAANKPLALMVEG